ncbi:enoyl-CoA hydratase-related protein [Tabrizicola sp. J26]|uniref:enoyl-CoA hydratase-related protein n=1 Tax=Alitabrizicola rongguiensis TaxID=2909234 RepID=UPI001F1F5986|nr:enoyl-CoA hydratase-related protein [Tabrizicola rongguiensis]MCF1710097.1 enoyl-CoA hydratase-related protein [Tabrizicola rongguiensis]
MPYETITYTEVDGLAVIALNRPEVMNALNRMLRGELIDAIGRAAGEARAVVLTGTGRAFCSGQDLSDPAMQGALDFEEVLNDEYVPLLMAIYDCPIPTISAVNGAAAGAGANLALAADVVIAAESSVFVQAFSRIGLIPDAGGTWWLPRQIGMPRAMGACLFADPVPARQAAEWGMIYEAVADSDFETRWRDRAMRLAQGPTAAYRAAKQALRAAPGNTLAEQLALEARLQGQCGRTEDFKEGVAAFLEKRKPRYIGA